MSAWTPGPWRVCDGRTQGRLTIESDDATIAYAAVGDGEDEDANLIAAAPDLYAALADTHTLLVAQGFFDAPVVKLAWDALRKARGEQSL